MIVLPLRWDGRRGGGEGEVRNLARGMWKEENKIQKAFNEFPKRADLETTGAPGEQGTHEDLTVMDVRVRQAEGGAVSASGRWWMKGHNRRGWGTEKALQVSGMKGR